MDSVPTADAQTADTGSVRRRSPGSGARAPDTVIELDAPHLSNEMNLSYRTPAFVQLENIGLKAQAQDKRTTEKSRL